MLFYENGITRGTIYAWIKENKQPQHKKVNVTALANNGFAELAILDSKEHKNHPLQKASFVFSEFSLMFEGNVG